MPLGTFITSKKKVTENIKIEFLMKQMKFSDLDT